MSAPSRHIVLMCLDSEIVAVERDIARTGHKADYFGNRQFDIRAAHLDKLRAARREVASE